jgi:hypothetical protein
MRDDQSRLVADTAEEERKHNDDVYLSASSGCDGVIDRDKATRNPNAPLPYRASFDSGDHGLDNAIHPCKLEFAVFRLPKTPVTTHQFERLRVLPCSSGLRPDRGARMACTRGNTKRHTKHCLVVVDRGIWRGSRGRSCRGVLWANSCLRECYR